MTQLNESPIITVERRKAVTIIISAVILSLAVGGGLMKVGSGFASRSSDGITVTGSAKTTATADNAVWTLSVSLSSPTVAMAVKKVDADTKGAVDGLHEIRCSAVLDPINEQSGFVVRAFAIQNFNPAPDIFKILALCADGDDAV